EDLLMKLGGRAAHEWQQRLALEPPGMLDAREIAQGREEIDVGNHGIADFAPREAARAAHDERRTHAVIGEMGLHGGGEATARAPPVPLIREPAAPAQLLHPSRARWL